MKFQGAFIKAIIPIISIVLALIGIVQLRSGTLAIGTVCIVLAVTAFVLSIQRLEKNPITSEELETLNPTLVPRVMWVIVSALVIISVIYVADNVKTVETDRIAVTAWVLAMLIGFILTWWRAIRLLLTDKFT